MVQTLGFELARLGFDGKKLGFGFFESGLGFHKKKMGFTLLNFLGLGFHGKKLGLEKKNKLGQKPSNLRGMGRSWTRNLVIYVVWGVPGPETS